MISFTTHTFLKDTPMTSIPFSLTNESVTVFVDGKPFTAQHGTIQFNGLRSALLREAWNEVGQHLTVEGSLQRWLGDKFAVDNGSIKYDNVRLPQGLSDRIVRMADSGEDPSPLFRFYERLHKNPSFRSREQLFDFMGHSHIPIEPDGTFLAYKGVNSDYTDCHTGQIPNTPGAVHTMPRNLVSDDPRTACHFGFHVGALSYASSFASVVVICRVDPEFVVCVPHDNSQQKMRVCQYEVVGNWNGEPMGSTEQAKVEVPSEDESADWNEDDSDDRVGAAVVVDGDGEIDEKATKLANKLLKEEAEGKALAGKARAAFVEKVTAFTKAKTPKYDKLDTKGLMEKPIEELRKYASAGLKILGASKIPGGKSALVSRIIKVRRRQK